MEYLQTFFAQYGALLAQGTWDTIVMSLVSTALAYVIGIPLGVFLVLTDPKKGLLPHKAVNAVLGWIEMCIRDRASMSALRQAWLPWKAISSCL